MDNIKNNESKSICGPCGGVCCKKSAGINSPYDFGKTYKQIKNEMIRCLKTGFYAIDYYDETVPTYWIRPAHTNAIGDLIDPSWGGTCRLWDDKRGCSLNFNERPYSCKSLVPSKTRSCRQPTQKIDMRSIWLGWQPTMRKIIKELENQ